MEETINGIKCNIIEIEYEEKDPYWNRLRDEHPLVGSYKIMLRKPDNFESSELMNLLNHITNLKITTNECTYFFTKLHNLNVTWINDVVIEFDSFTINEKRIIKCK